MKPLRDCLEQARGKSPQDFVREHPHPVLIGLGVLPGELQSNPAKASGTLFLNLSPDQVTGGPAQADDALVNQVFDVRKRASGEPGERVEVGGTVESDVDVPDHTVSRNHAWFELGGPVIKLIDGGSTNGTYINGTRLIAEKPTEVKSGDIITFGRYSFTFYEAMAFAKLLSVQAMMRPRGPARRPSAGRPTAQLGGAGPRPGTAPRPVTAARGPVVRRPLEGGEGEQPSSGSAPVSRPSSRGGGASKVVDPFLGPPRAGRFTSPEEARRAAASTDPRRAFPGENGQTANGPGSPKNATSSAVPAPPASVEPTTGFISRLWAGLKRLGRWLLGMQ